MKTQNQNQLPARPTSKPLALFLFAASQLALLQQPAQGFAQDSATTDLNLQTYLNQVVESNQAIQADLKTRDGTSLRSRDARLAISPTLFANVSLLDDKKSDPLFRTAEQTRNNYSIGISQQTTFGLLARASYNIDYTHYEYLPASGTPAISFHQGRPILELSQSLWRNGFGTETRALLEASEAAALSTSFASSYQSRVVLAQAESAYWQLSYARSSVRVTSNVLERAQKLYDWNARRVRLRLADESDLLQAEALLKLRKLDFQQAKDNERIASRTFNQLREVDSDQVAEIVTELGPKVPIPTSPPTRAPMREDVKAAQEQSRAAVASAKVANEKDKPTVEVFGTLSLNGIDPNLSPALSNSFKTDQPTVLGGVRVSMPLNFGLMSDAHRGYALEQQGAERAYQRRFFEQESEWTDLNQRLTEAKNRYTLYQNVEAAQREKLRVERERLSRGKTTTFNVIQFEQDAAQSELGTLRAQTEILQILAQLKTFGGPL
jgi:outer membrane protein TolC